MSLTFAGDSTANGHSMHWYESILLMMTYLPVIIADEFARGATTTSTGDELLLVFAPDGADEPIVGCARSCSKSR